MYQMEQTTNMEVMVGFWSYYKGAAISNWCCHYKQVHCINQELKVVQDTIKLNEIELSRKHLSRNYVYENALKIFVIFQIKVKSVNTEFKQRWIMHLYQAFKAFLNDLNIVISVIARSMNELISSTSAENIRKQDELLTSLRFSCSDHANFTI